MGRLRNWWQRLTGRPLRPIEPRNRAEPPSEPAVPGATDGLSLQDEVPTRKASRVGAAGFDPYASDAGYSKPHSWERVDHD